ncbi:MAG: Membrane-bound metallopeptidase [Parcubacteria group bacterium GW2011_GWA2_51_10]|nr:MAG: Membrane-bound metallopeptidase [Parcubacteria group bacterium GW2011_GWA2_51_10]
MSRALSFVLLIVLFAAPFVSFAQTRDELQQEIDRNSVEIEKLNKEIAQFQTQLDSTVKQKNTLQNQIAQLDLQRKKLTASINLTKNQIKTTQLQIQQLAGGIAKKESTIESNEAGLAESIRRMAQTEEIPFSISLLSAENISEAWQDADAIANIQDAVSDDIDRLATEKESLTEIKTDAEKKRVQLQKEQQTLLTQQGSLNATRKAQADLLAETKSQESTYQALLAQKQAAKANFESALLDLQARLQYTVDPSKITAVGKGILQWPLDKVRLTQEFGNSSFALAGAYNGKGHNGIDLAASIGTPVRAARGGVVKGTGDTGSVKGCYSYGRWVLVRHENGLDTLYAHLSQINVTAEESVVGGQVIGYSGQTGYATGPHLHFGVYASTATQIMKLGDATNKKTSCSEAMMPIAPLSGYLNPMNYL